MKDTCNDPLKKKLQREHYTQSITAVFTKHALIFGQTLLDEFRFETLQQNLLAHFSSNQFFSTNKKTDASDEKTCEPKNRDGVGNAQIVVQNVCHASIFLEVRNSEKKLQLTKLLK